MSGSMRLWLKSRTKPLVFEVLQYDPARKHAVLRSANGTYEDKNFDVVVLRRFYDLVREDA